MNTRIAEILDFHFWSLDKSKQTNRLNIQEAEQALLAYFNEVIGEDEPEDYCPSKACQRNFLRAELRKKLRGV